MAAAQYQYEVDCQNCGIHYQNYQTFGHERPKTNTCKNCGCTAQTYNSPMGGVCVEPLGKTIGGVGLMGTPNLSKLRPDPHHPLCRDSR